MRLLRALVELLRAWWSVDRIRVARDEGALLRLRPGAILDIDGRTVEITNRRVDRRAAAIRIEYAVLTREGIGHLRVHLPADAIRATIEWFDEVSARHLDEQQITIWREGMSREEEPGVRCCGQRTTDSCPLTPAS